MKVRIIPEQTIDTLIAAIDRARQNVDTSAQQVATGRKVNEPSDDPVAVGTFIENSMQASTVDQFSRSIAGVQSLLQAADSALNGVVQDLTQTVSLGTRGANGTLSDSERQAIADQVSQIQQHILSLANTSYQGSYVFAGTAVTSQPFTVDLIRPPAFVTWANKV